MSEKQKKREKRRKRKSEDDTEYLERIDARMLRANLKLDKKRRQDYIV